MTENFEESAEMTGINEDKNTLEAVEEELVESAEGAEEIIENAEEIIEGAKDAEVPLEPTEEETDAVLAEEGSLDGSDEEVEKLASEATDETSEELVEEEQAETATQTVDQAETPVESVGPVAEPEENKEAFKLTAPENLEEIMSKICAKRARKLIYRPNEEIFSMTCAVLGTDKNNEEKISVKKILEAEIKEGVKLGYIDKFDGLKGSELKEEYENDIVYEYAEQEFKRTGLLYDGKKVKVYVFDWDLKACHHVGYIPDEDVEKIKPYLIDSEKYSFDVDGIITGGKYKKVIKDETTGKITVEKGNDGKLGVELDVTVINRKD